MAFDVDFPNLLGAELFRPDSTYIAKYVLQSQVVHDFGTAPATSVQLDRYGYFGDSDAFYTESARVRSTDQTIGTSGARGLNKTKVLVTLQNFTGPSAGDPNDPGKPGNLQIPVGDIIRAMRFLYDLNNPSMFHQSIGSLTLIQDWRRWQDRVYINQALTAGAQGVATRNQGGYYNPLGIPDGGTYAVGPQQVVIHRDVDQVVTDMRQRNVPPYPCSVGPVYHGLCGPVFIKHLRRDKDFLEVARYPGMIPIEALRPGQMPMSAPVMPGSPMPMGGMMAGGGGHMPNWAGQPNSLIQQGPFYGQSGYMYGDMMPTGFVFEGVRWFDSTNLPTATVPLTYTATSPDYPNVPTGSANRTGDIAIISGQQCIGEGVYGQGPQVAVNENTDYGRFLQAIWTQDSGYAVLNPSFFTIMRSYEN